MKGRMINEGPPRTFVVVFDKGDEVIQGLLRFAEEHDLTASELTGLGAFSSCVLGYFDWERKDYNRIRIDEQVEVLAFIGNITTKDGKHKLHPHVVVGKSDGTAHGAHLLEAQVRPTLEVVINESPRHLERREDPETGLPLIAL